MLTLCSNEMYCRFKEENGIQQTYEGKKNITVLVEWAVPGGDCVGHSSRLVARPRPPASIPQTTVLVGYKPPFSLFRHQLSEGKILNINKCHYS